jgi:hypothetical protein
MSYEDNQNLNLNPARPDRFFLRLGDIPSIPLLTPKEAGVIDKLKLNQDDKDFFHIALRTAQLPGVGLGEVKIPTMLAPLSDSDMVFSFDTFSTNMKMDSNYILYKMFILWIFMIKHPEYGSQGSMKQIFEKTTTTGILTLRDNFNAEVLSIELYELRPLVIPTIDLDYSNEGDEIMLPITWSYSYFMPKTGAGQSFSVDWQK